MSAGIHLSATAYDVLADVLIREAEAHEAKGRCPQAPALQRSDGDETTTVDRITHACDGSGKP
jgi:hypothetical protein